MSYAMEKKTEQRGKGWGAVNRVLFKIRWLRKHWQKS